MQIDRVRLCPPTPSPPSCPPSRHRKPENTSGMKMTILSQPQSRNGPTTTVETRITWIANSTCFLLPLLVGSNADSTHMLAVALVLSYSCCNCCSSCCSCYNSTTLTVRGCSSRSSRSCSRSTSRSSSNRSSSGSSSRTSCSSSILVLAALVVVSAPPCLLWCRSPVPVDVVNPVVVASLR